MPDQVAMKVLTIGFDYVEVLMPHLNPAQEKEWYKVRFSDLVGIPLTERRIKKMSFEYDNKEYRWKPKKCWHPYVFSQYDSPKEIFGDRPRDMTPGSMGLQSGHLVVFALAKKVHELQNCHFGLTGSDLNIDTNDF
jgi:hypothetical protein